MAKSAVAADLNSAVPSGAYRFESCPGHREASAGWVPYTIPGDHPFRPVADAPTGAVEWSLERAAGPVDCRSHKFSST